MLFSTKRKRSIASIQVLQESHVVLDWVFNKTEKPSLIEAQGNGQLLKVPEVWDFKVEWHLRAHVKSIKVMHGLKHGANSKHIATKSARSL